MSVIREEFFPFFPAILVVLDNVVPFCSAFFHGVNILNVRLEPCLQAARNVVAVEGASERVANQGVEAEVCSESNESTVGNVEDVDDRFIVVVGISVTERQDCRGLIIGRL